MSPRYTVRTTIAMMLFMACIPLAASAQVPRLQDVLAQLTAQLTALREQIRGEGLLGQVISADTTPIGAISIASYGAVSDGVTDNYAAINRAVADAKNLGKSVYVPQGTFAYNGVIKIDGIKLHGGGDTSVLYALNWDRSAIFMYGNRVEVSNLKLTGVTAPSRQAHWEATRISIFGATDFVVDRVTIEGAGAAGIQTAKGVNGGRITNNVVKNTLSDGIHMTDRATNLVVENNYVEGTGDDGIAVVSYQADGGYVSNITARYNTVKNIKWGRLMSVVGGKNVLYEHNYLDTNLAKFACMYLAQEASYATYGAHDVTVRYNTFKNCGTSATGHGAVMLYSDGFEPNTNITFTRNHIVQNGWLGFHIFNDNKSVTLDNNKIEGASLDYEIRNETEPITIIKYTSGEFGQQLTQNGVCGSATGVLAYSAPTSNLCTTGTASQVTVGTQTYSWTCAGISGGTTATCEAPRGYAQPTVSLVGNPLSIAPGGSVTLSWSAANADSCTSSGGWSGTRATLGTFTVNPLTSTTYSLTCTGAGGTASSQVSVTVTATPTQTLTAGDTVYTTERLNVRAQPSTSAKRLGSQSRGAVGVIVSGPVSDGRYEWWNINYAQGADGWSVGAYIREK